MGSLLKIGICGAHGAGKSTLALALAAWHKSRYPYMRVGIITEVARSCPLNITEVVTPPAQQWIFHAQWQREIEESSRNNVVICDRTVLDAAAYSAANGLMYLTTLWMPLIESWWVTYDTVYFMPPAGDIADDGVRRLGREYQQRVHAAMEGLINTWHLPVVRYDQNTPPWAEREAAR